MPRHLRDGEHELSAQETFAGVDDPAPSRGRGWLLWISLAALAGAVAWWWA
jgi:hypothetical protein